MSLLSAVLSEVPADVDEPWIRVRTRKSRNKLKSILPTDFTDYAEEDDLCKLRKKFFSISSYFTQTVEGRRFLDSLLCDLRKAFPACLELNHESVDVLCLGLGNPAVDRASLRQLALLDLLIDQDTRLTRSRTLVYDPVFRSVARQFIRERGMQVISENKEACYTLSPDRYHFVMLPHCAPALINNLLRTNWTPDLLGRLVMFSNGWNQIFMELIASGEQESLIKQNLGQMTLLGPVMSIGDCNRPSAGTPGRRKFQEEVDFEGMRLQWFRTENLKSLPSNVWTPDASSTIGESCVRQNHSDAVVDRFQADLISRHMFPAFVDSKVAP